MSSQEVFNDIKLEMQNTSAVHNGEENALVTKNNGFLLTPSGIYYRILRNPLGLLVFGLFVIFFPVFTTLTGYAIRANSNVTEAPELIKSLGGYPSACGLVGAYTSTFFLFVACIGMMCCKKN